MTYTSVDFDKDRLADCTLLVTVGHGETALAIVDADQQLQFLTTFDPSSIDQQAKDILTLDFKQVRIAARHNGYSFVPAELFDETQMPVYRRYLPDEQLGDPHVIDIASLGIKLICQVSRLETEAITGHFHNAMLHPTIEVLLQNIAAKGTNTSELTAFINKAGSSIGIYIFDSGNFRYGNDFELNGLDDLNYYVLAVLDHIGVEGAIKQVYLSGDWAANDDHYQRIAKYSKTISFVDTKRLTGIAVPEELQSHQHRFLTLFGLHSCG